MRSARSLAAPLTPLTLAALIASGCDPVTPIYRIEEPNLPIDDDELPVGEGEEEPAEGEGEEQPACTPADLGALGSPDKPRVVLVGHGYGPASGSVGTEIRSMSLDAATLTDDGVRLDVGVRPARIAFVPSGALALVLADDGFVVSVRVDDVATLAVVDTLELPGSGYGDVRVSGDGTRAFAVNFDVDPAQTGVHEILVGCDGALTLGTGFASARLSSSVAMLGADRALLLGGAASFEPVDPDDVRVLGLSPALTELSRHDVFLETPDTTRIAASPDGTRVVVPNGSPFTSEGGTVVLLDVSAGVVELDRKLNLETASEAVFADARTVLVSRWEADAVTIFDTVGGTLVQTRELAGIGLAEHMDVVTRGPAAGLVLVAATNAVGNIHLVQAGGGTATSLGRVDLGEGFEDIPATVAVQP